MIYMKAKKALEVTVLYGGISTERNVSIESGKNVSEALRSQGYKVKDIDVDEAFIASPPDLDCDVAFVALHGEYGEDGGIQSVLEEQGIAFTGSSSESSFIGMDKEISRDIFKRVHLEVPPGFVLDGLGDLLSDPRLASLAFPIVVKPASQGSSIGLDIAHIREELEEAVAKARAYDNRVLVERFISGTEVTVGIIGDIVLPVIVVKPEHELFDFTCKYAKGTEQFSFDSDVTEKMAGEIEKCAKTAYDALSCRGVARVDMIVGEDGKIYVLEVNTIPGMTSHSLVPLAALRAGISFVQLCSMVVELAYGKVLSRVETGCRE